MGAPIAAGVVPQMIRVFNKNAGGRIYLYDPNDADLATFEQGISSSSLVMEGTYNPSELPSPFNEIYFSIAAKTKTYYVMSYRWDSKEL